MNRQEAKKLALTISIEDLKQMFLNAQEGIKDWNETSRVNKNITKGIAFNILSKCYDDEGVWRKESVGSIIAKTNMLREFGEWLPL